MFCFGLKLLKGEQPKTIAGLNRLQPFKLHPYVYILSRAFKGEYFLSWSFDRVVVLKSQPVKIYPHFVEKHSDTLCETD